MPRRTPDPLILRELRELVAESEYTASMMRLMIDFETGVPLTLDDSAKLLDFAQRMGGEMFPGPEWCNQLVSYYELEGLKKVRKGMKNERP